MISVTKLNSRFLLEREVQMGMLRLDKLHPHISGNKWFKLHRLIQRLEKGERPNLISFGGAWSNHLHALAYVGHCFGVKTLGFVRGHPESPPTAMLDDVRGWGMEIRFLGREAYRQKDKPAFLAELTAEYPGWVVIPEGGSGADAVHGCRQIWADMEVGEWSEPDILACAVGTGGTLAGLVAGKPPSTEVIGVPVLNLGENAVAMVRGLLEQAGYVDPGGWHIDSQGVFGGYARLPGQLALLDQLFSARHHFDLDPVYTLKLVMSIHRGILRGSIPAGSRVLLVHSGGLQGRRGFQDRIQRAVSDFYGPLPL
ncbi:1-aminocyclopropane-1-carboxylate deaminase/D-cysteine desulfhydrase [Marinobacterium litorale]|uniref:1-aminocyclopropane-1-carboxylate deaminase/D-cysteine desulfhydrase n=1 Tax=Marinobacterium litorale TaxID=404770 RepID=UPI00068523DD|nr:pyridoxal-phosphate dependent enzyme [Marinobacterium litorale]